MLETAWRYPCGCYGKDGVCRVNHTAMGGNMMDEVTAAAERLRQYGFDYFGLHGDLSPGRDAATVAEAYLALTARQSQAGLFQHGDFLLASGARSPWKIDCGALMPTDWDALARMLYERLPPFGAIEGVPTGGLPLAVALTPYATAGPLLIVDDVWTSGGSWERVRAGRATIGAVVFARGPVPPHVTALFQMDAGAEVERLRRERDGLLAALKACGVEKPTVGEGLKRMCWCAGWASLPCINQTRCVANRALLATTEESQS